MVCNKRERVCVKGRSIPLPLYLNQQVLRLAVKNCREQRGKQSSLCAPLSVDRKKSRAIELHDLARWWNKKGG